MSDDKGIILNAYIGSCSISSMGKRKIVLDVPENCAVEFLAAQTLHNKYVRVTIEEIGEGE